ncbi:hypothetical protein CYMTET_41283, partial [Cymbomonas tetramitiformis]
GRVWAGGSSGGGGYEKPYSALVGHSALVDSGPPAPYSALVGDNNAGGAYGVNGYGADFPPSSLMAPNPPSTFSGGYSTSLCLPVFLDSVQTSVEIAAKPETQGLGVNFTGGSADVAFKIFVTSNNKQFKTKTPGPQLVVCLGSKLPVFMKTNLSYLDCRDAGFGGSSTGYALFPSGGELDEVFSSGPPSGGGNGGGRKGGGNRGRGKGRGKGKQQDGTSYPNPGRGGGLEALLSQAQGDIYGDR